MSILVLVLLFAFWGLCTFWIRQMRLSPYCAPLVSICTITLIVFGFGLLGLLQIGLFIITGIGIVLGILALVQAPKSFFQLKLLLLLVACALLWLRYHNAILLQYDDFSHWGLIARYLLSNNALPDQSAVLIKFQSYPPAAACWIYAICFFAGSSEGIMITAQAWFTLIALLPLFSVTHKSTIPVSIGISVLIVIVLSVYYGTASLMVDNLLAATAIGCSALAINICQKPNRSSWPLAIALTVLCLIKDSGLYFALLVIILYTILLRSSHQPKKVLFPIILLPVAGRIAWWVHMQTAFTAASTTKHTFTLENFTAIGSDRTWEQLLSIGKAVLRHALSYQSQTLIIISLMVLCCAVIICLRYYRTRQWHLAQEGFLLIFSVISYGVYLLFLLGMYYYTMPIEAALRAIAFERYNITFALFLYGLFTIYLLQIPLTSLPWKRLIPFIVTLMIALPITVSSFNSGIRRLISETYRLPVREQIAQLEKTRPLESDETAALYLGNQSSQIDFISYIAAYTFQQTIPLYTANTLDSASLPDVLYSLEEDSIIDSLRTQGSTEIITP